MSAVSTSIRGGRRWLALVLAVGAIMVVMGCDDSGSSGTDRGDGAVDAAVDAAGDAAIAADAGDSMVVDATLDLDLPLPDAAPVACVDQPTFDIVLDGMPICLGVPFAGEAGASTPPQWGALFIAECEGFRVTGVFYFAHGLPAMLPAQLEPDVVSVDLFDGAGLVGRGGRKLGETPDAPMSYAPLVSASVTVSSPTCLAGEIDTFIARLPDASAERRRLVLRFAGAFRAL